MKRYYLAPIVGDGKSTDTAYRAKLPIGIKGHVALIPTDATGKPLHAWCLVLVSAAPAVHAAIAADPQTDALPGIGWAERPVDKLTTAAQQTMVTRLGNRGLTAQQATAVLSMTLRQIVRLIGQRHVATFDEANFGVTG